MVIEERGESIFFDIKDDAPDYDGDKLEIPVFFLQEDNPPKIGVKIIHE